MTADPQETGKSSQACFPGHVNVGKALERMSKGKYSAGPPVTGGGRWNRPPDILEEQPAAVVASGGFWKNTPEACPDLLAECLSDGGRVSILFRPNPPSAESAPKVC